MIKYIKLTDGDDIQVTDFGLPQWMIIDADSVVFGLSHCADVDNVARVSDVHSASIFRVKVCKFVSFCVYSIGLRKG
jgi:hypothetical protein